MQVAIVTSFHIFGKFFNSEGLKKPRTEPDGSARQAGEKGFSPA